MHASPLVRPRSATPAHLAPMVLSLCLTAACQGAANTDDAGVEDLGVEDLGAIRDFASGDRAMVLRDMAVFLYDFTRPPRDLTELPDLTVVEQDLALRPDLTGVPFGCRSLADCESGCASQACSNACLAMVNTVGGVGLYNQQTACLVTACPTTNGGVCDTKGANYNSAACVSCLQAAQTGACSGEVNRCSADG